MSAPPLSPMLDRLAEDRATGALLRDTGVLYLADGAVVHAESPAAPGIETLLTAGGRLPAERWREAVERAGARCEIGPYLREHGAMAGGELEIRHLGALYDAAYFVLAPGGGPTRFRPGAVHWFGRLRPVGVRDVERETRRRRRYLAALCPNPRLDTAAPVRAASARLPPATRRQQDVLGLADGRRTPSEIATLLGRPAFHTLVDIRRLAAAGHLRTPAAGPPPGAGRPVAAPAWMRDIAGDPDAALLRRLRDALEAHL